MSSTIFHRVAVWALPTTTTTYYLLDAETAESNTDTRTPHWCFRHFGDYQSCMDFIVWYSSFCESGNSSIMLGGNTSPETMIKWWRNALAQPLLYRGKCAFSFGKGIYNVPEKMRDAVAQVLSGVVEVVNQASITLDVANPVHCEAIARLCKLDDVYPWRLFESRQGAPAPEYAVSLPCSNVSLLGDIRYFDMRYDGHNVGEQYVWYQPHAEPVFLGHKYRAMQVMGDTHIKTMERAHPGSAERLFHQLRNKMKSATLLPDTTQVKLLRDTTDQYTEEAIATLLGKLNITVPDSVVVLDLKYARDYEIARLLMSLGTEHVKFQLEKQPLNFELTLS